MMTSKTEPARTSYPGQKIMGAASRADVRKKGTRDMVTRRRVLGGLVSLSLFPACQIAPPLRAQTSAGEDFGIGVSYVGRLIWRREDPDFGGFSGLHLAGNGLDLLTVSDRGTLWEGQFRRDAAGQVISVDITGKHRLLDPEGRPLPRASADAESVTRGPDGVIYIAFEGGTHARVSAFDAAGGRERPLPRHPDFAHYPTNQSLEALAMDPQGRLHVFSETPRAGGFAVYRFDPDSQWRVAGQVPQRGAFVPVGADFGPDGAFYLLERQFQRPFFASRVSRIDRGAWERPKTVLQTPMGSFDNLEGLAVTTGPDGRLRATMISDDNFNWFQRTEIVEFLFPA